MSTGELLARLVGKLDGAGIPHMVAGSFASTYHGEPRATQDIDVVVEPTVATLETLLASLPDQDYYVDRDAALDALSRRSQFNVIDMETGWKIDLIIRKDRPFSIEEFSRRQAAKLFGAAVYVAREFDHRQAGMVEARRLRAPATRRGWHPDGPRGHARPALHRKMGDRVGTHRAMAARQAVRRATATCR